LLRDAELELGDPRVAAPCKYKIRRPEKPASRKIRSTMKIRRDPWSGIAELQLGLEQPTREAL
jgi:hypothetical protein